jgi:crotonobetainyl-CoA:carnitine CoA-transferase CaiB-like acyl-CoA transferase
MAHPLDDITVLDLSRVLAGPWATQLLADLGAEVIKIERPGTGDDTRAWGPPWLDSTVSDTRAAAYYLSTNRGKRSVAVDIATPEGAALVARLAVSADVVVENFKAGSLGKYGLDYTTLARVNPRLVYCSITGFGQSGPYAKRPGYDFLAQGMSGMMSVTGAPDGEPMKVGVAVADVFTGLYACNAIQAALLQRQRTGRGAYIDMALLDTQVAVMANQSVGHLVSGRNPARQGNAHPSIVPYQSFAAADAELLIAVGNDNQFSQLCRVLEAPELANDPAYATNEARVRNRDALVALLSEKIRTQSVAYWLERLESARIPAGPVLQLDQVFADPQVRHRHLRHEQESAVYGTVPGVRCPILMSGTTIGSDLPPPGLGEHTDDVLTRKLGLSSAEITELRRNGILQ